ncbi:antitoxin ParD1/3/4 [Rhizobium rosettiformans]|uniref:Antitoxin ParD1/3/4 n=1 Tax=Rhizobium rosettiformans TaxID=1368430 RepID=A0A7W8MD23_9HYPH|nr:type II toxin-antitoxin system ParD family antitoxin [Rhizobium rosettiformans]MBA4797955.1 type II toxin-antitoxin system ParD family antitoxin [Hyphomicrobiales bacterium]MBB5276387.1 antitoxin ParD1/3/4 [Rhizobium rosettiformans]
MAKLSIRLPDKMKQFVDDQTQEGQFADEAAYIQDLINQDQERQKEVARIQAIVDAGIASGESDESMLDILHSLKDQRNKSA